MEGKYNNILTNLEDNTMIITLNRPDKLNALNIETFKELKEIIIHAEKNKEVYGIIITGSGPKAFVAGADISEFSNFSIEEGKLLAANGQEVLNMIEGLSKPVIAAVNGFALGGGCELAMACHLRIASENAKFGQPEVNLGIIPGYGGTQRLIQYVGKTKAMELLMTGDMLNAQTALDLGLVNHVTTQTNLISMAKELLAKIYDKSPQAISKVIKSVNAYFDKTVNGFQFEIDAFSSCCNTFELKEGTQAFLEKRKAQFRK